MTLSTHLSKGEKIIEKRKKSYKYLKYLFIFILLKIIEKNNFNDDYEQIFKFYLQEGGVQTFPERL